MDQDLAKIRDEFVQFKNEMESKVQDLQSAFDDLMDSIEQDNLDEIKKTSK